MVLKADNCAAAGGSAALKREVSDHALPGADGIEVDRADEIALLTVPCLIVITEHLIPAADGKNGFAVLDGGFQLAVLSAAEIGEQNLLLKVLSAADEDEIESRKVRRIAGADLGDLGLESAPLQTAAEAQDVAAVAVEVQEIGIQVADLQLCCAHSQNSFPPRRFCSWLRRSSIAV